MYRSSGEVFCTLLAINSGRDLRDVSWSILVPLETWIKLEQPLLGLDEELRTRFSL